MPAEAKHGSENGILILPLNAYYSSDPFIKILHSNPSSLWLLQSLQQFGRYKHSYFMMSISSSNIRDLTR
ncbi:hypothetical protein L6164_008469 [Bauhinia variegata]|uniref:Uncharacterized protein n=1 Tax=Bauhinia variegata TaxID=167791 RepID=A0ACB9PFZ9_BAUVA|nr:hypothetical protein L6164_008469 [Bauhinia variegata]